MRIGTYKLTGIHVVTVSLEGIKNDDVFSKDEKYQNNRDIQD